MEDLNKWIQNKLINEVDLSKHKKAVMLIKKLNKNKNIKDNLSNQIYKYYKYYELIFTEFQKYDKLPKKLNTEINFFIQSKIDSNNLKNSFYPIFIKISKKLISWNSLFASKLKGYNQILIKSKDEKEIINNFFLEWKESIFKECLNYLFESIKYQRRKNFKKFYDRIKLCYKFKDFLKIFPNAFNYLWYYKKKKPQKNSLNLIAQYSKYLKKYPEISDITNEIGLHFTNKGEVEFIKPFDDLDSKTIKTKSIGWPDDINGIINSDNIRNIIPSELLYISNEFLKTIFYKKYSDKSLYNILYESENLLKTNEKLSRKGDVLICVDSSSSLAGVFELISKTVTFSIVNKILANEFRECLVLSFSSKMYNTNIFNPKKNLGLFNDFLKRKYEGGTNMFQVLSYVCNFIASKKEKEEKFYDILFISDFIVYDQVEKLFTNIKKLKDKKHNFYAITLGNNGNKALLKNFNKVWNFNYNNKKGFLIKE